MAILSAALLYLFIGYVLQITRGHYYEDFIPAYTFVYFLCVALMIHDITLKTVTFKFKTLFIALTTFGLFFFALLLIDEPNVIYHISNEIEDGFKGTLIANGVLASILTLCIVYLNIGTNPSHQRKTLKLFKLSAAGMAVALITALFLTPSYSPHPFIDVFINNSAGIDFFLKGENPYNQTYVDIYKGAIPDKPGFLYPPGIIFWLAPFQMLLGDHRYGYAMALLIMAVLLYRIVKRRAKTQSTLLMAWMIPLLWLSFPVTYFVLEQSWLDTLILLFVLMLIECFENKKWIQAALLIGFIATIKQHTFIISIFALFQLWQLAGFSWTIRAVGIATATFLIILVPFVATGWTGFWEMTLTPIHTPGYRLNSLGMTDYMVREWNFYLPRWTQACITILSMAAGLFIMSKDSRKTLNSFIVAILLCYGCTYFFGKVAYCNYHYLLAFFTLLYLALSMDRFETQR
jgi:hypothetical protein